MWSAHARDVRRLGCADVLNSTCLYSWGSINAEAPPATFPAQSRAHTQQVVAAPTPRAGAQGPGPQVEAPRLCERALGRVGGVQPLGQPRLHCCRPAGGWVPSHGVQALLMVITAKAMCKHASSRAWTAWGHSLCRSLPTRLMSCNAFGLPNAAPLSCPALPAA